MIGFCSVRKLTSKEKNKLKREVKKTTGRNMKDIEIISFGSDFITFGYYATNYDRATGKLTTETIER